MKNRDKDAENIYHLQYAEAVIFSGFPAKTQIENSKVKVKSKKNPVPDSLSFFCFSVLVAKTL
ncbi:MAG: hypothetical protein JWQ27_1349 [Ferruginibacter sp.]|nr:hypothetical protein [Ferruginibacter sp.]